jgi:hypothetical protein
VRIKEKAKAMGEGSGRDFVLFRDWGRPTDMEAADVGKEAAC